MLNQVFNTCVSAMPCSSFSVSMSTVNSSTSLYFGESVHVSCDHGYCSNMADTQFNVTCDYILGQMQLENLKACQGILNRYIQYTVITIL